MTNRTEILTGEELYRAIYDHGGNAGGAWTDVEIAEHLGVDLTPDPAHEP